jgi:adenylosuccinate lyase
MPCMRVPSPLATKWRSGLEIRRHIQRMQEYKDRIMVGHVSDAVGTMARVWENRDRKLKEGFLEMLARRAGYMLAGSA